MSNDKSIKFSFAIDKRSLQEVKTGISELTAAVKTLVETAERAGQALRGLGGGRGLMGGVSGKTGGINASQESTMKGGGMFTQGIASDAANLTKMARVGSDALRGLTAAVKSNFSGQASEVIALERSLEKLESRYTRLKSVADVGGAKTQGHIQSQMISTEIERDAVRAQIGGHMEARAARDAASQVMGGDDGAPPPSFYSRARKALWGSKPQGMWGQLAAMGEENVGWGGTASLGVLGAGGMVAAAGMAGYKIGNQIVQTANAFSGGARDDRSALLRYETAQPLLGLQQQARIGGVFGGMGLELMQDGAGKAVAIEQALRSSAVRDYFSTHYQDKIKEAIDMETRQDGSFASSNESAEAEGWQRFRAWATGGPTDTVTQNRMDQMMRKTMLSAENAEMFGGVVGNIMQAAPTNFAMIQQAYSGAPGFASMLRQSGVGGQGGRMVAANNLYGLTYDPSIPVSQSAATLAAKAGNYMGKYGYSLEQGLGLESEYGAVAGRGARGAGPSLNVLREGGLGNAFQLGAAGVSYGGAGFMRAVQGSIGSGGADITAGGSIAGIIAAEMMSGNYRGNGGGAVSQLLGWAGPQGTGDSTGASMRMANTISKGYGSAGGALGGKYSPLQQAMYWANANAVMPGNVYGANELAGMSWGERLDLETGHGDSDRNKGYGLTADASRKMREGSAKSMFSEFHSSLANGMDPELLKSARALAGGAKMGDELSRLQDVYGGQNPKNLEHALKTLSMGITTGTASEKMGAVLGLIGPEDFKAKGSGAGSGLDPVTQGILKKKAEDVARQIVSEQQGGSGALGANLGDLGGALRSTTTDFKDLRVAIGGLLKILGVKSSAPEPTVPPAPERPSATTPAHGAPRSAHSLAHNPDYVIPTKK